MSLPHRAVRGALRVAIQPYRWMIKSKMRRASSEARANVESQRHPQMRDVPEQGIRVIGEPSAAESLDFLTWRGPAYVEPMSTGLTDALADALFGLDPPSPVDADGLFDLLTTTPGCYLAEEVDGRWVFDFSAHTYISFQTRAIDALSYDLEGRDLVIMASDGTTLRAGDPHFERALAHAVAWWANYVPGGLHNWVHFHLPCNMVNAVSFLSSSDSVLARLLAPHVRFTARINYAGLWENKSTDNGPERKWFWTHPYAAVATRVDEFRDGVLINTGADYADLAAHIARPKQLDTRLRYHRYLSAWYPPIRRFVEAVDPLIEDDAWAELLAQLEGPVPGIGQLERVDVLSAFIWQVGVVHAADHRSYAPLAGKHGFYRVPDSLDTPFGFDQVSRWDRWNTRNFLNVYVGYHGVSGLEHSMLDVQNYGFTGEAAVAADQLATDLRQVEAELSKAGDLLLPADKLIQSVCF